MKQRLRLNIDQYLAITPQRQQAIRLLQLILRLNPKILLHLCINSCYASLTQRINNGIVNDFLKSTQTRQETLLIVNYQKEFFEYGI